MYDRTTNKKTPTDAGWDIVSAVSNMSEATRRDLFAGIPTAPMRPSTRGTLSGLLKAA